MKNILLIVSFLLAPLLFAGFVVLVLDGSDFYFLRSIFIDTRKLDRE